MAIKYTRTRQYDGHRRGDRLGVLVAASSLFAGLYGIALLLMLYVVAVALLLLDLAPRRARLESLPAARTSKSMNIFGEIAVVLHFALFSVA